MPKSKEKVILNTSDEAATYQTGIEGWVDHNGRFYGKDERTARWSGCTHIICSECEKPENKNYTMCADCRLKKSIERYNKMDQKKWDGKTPLYSHRVDRYFFDFDELEDELVFLNCSVEFLRLIICEPMYLRQIDEDYFCDDLPEDGELSEDVWSMLKELNEVIKNQGIVGWMPGKYAAVMPSSKDFTGNL